jgi:hypothetical protein
MRSGLIVNEEPQLLGHQLEQVDVEPDDRLAVLGEELARRVGGVAADRDHPVGGDAVGHATGQGLVGGDAGQRRRRAAAGAAVAGVGRAAATAGERQGGAGQGHRGDGRTAERADEAHGGLLREIGRPILLRSCRLW